MENVFRRGRFLLTQGKLATAGPRFHAGPRGLLGRGTRIAVRRGGSMTIGEHLVTGADVFVASSGSLTIGDDVFLNDRTRIVAHERITIGDHVVIASGVSILDHDHRTDVRDGHLVIERDEFVTAPITIGSNVWLGDKVTVLKGITIGDDVIVGANSVVTRDVEPGTIVAGVPATPIRSLDLET